MIWTLCIDSILSIFFQGQFNLRYILGSLALRVKSNHKTYFFRNSVLVFKASDKVLNLVVLVEPLCHLNCNLCNS